ncbi:MAG: hypothetical protein ACT6S0_22325 [Roseateles sp.]|uniref:hypothetical protein n=1 Tax=Roseateles sp. TaxID=1971397 RepID=UPI0040353FEB
MCPPPRWACFPSSCRPSAWSPPGCWACRPTPPQRLDDFDARWNASDAWGLTAQFAMDGSLGAAGEVGRQAVYRELVERLGRSPQARQTRLLRVRDVGQACLVDVQVRSGERSEAGLFLLAHAREGGIVAMR